jgi:hypothetical protein
LQDFHSKKINSMKAQVFFFVIVCFLGLSIQTMGQCVADAGPDRVVCNSWNAMDTIALGGNPSAAGGVAPYTYTWETNWQVGNWNFTASDFLDDTTAANPLIIHSAEQLNFILTVVDSESTVCKDTVQVGFTNFGTHLGTISYTIDQGDSVFLSGMHNVFGGFPPYEYLWRPQHGLTDSTSLSFWAKPDSSVAYALTLTDASGCSATGAPVYFVHVNPVSVNKLTVDNERLHIFPNPAQQHITIMLEGTPATTKTIVCTNTMGRRIFQSEMHNNLLQLDTQLMDKGVVLVQVFEAGRLVGEKKISVQ